MTPNRIEKKEKTALATDMLIAQLEADLDDTGTLEEFMTSLDLREYAKVLDSERLTLADLRASSAADLKSIGIPAGARKKIIAALHPELLLN